LPFDNAIFIICASVKCQPESGAPHIPINPTDESMSLFLPPHLRAWRALANGRTAAVAGMAAVLMVTRDGAPPGAGVDG
jgi:hypothetical protein